MKFLCGIVSFIGAVFSVVGVIVVFVLGCYVLNIMWDYAYLHFGELGIGFMICFCGVLILLILISIAKDIFKGIYKSKKEED